MKKAILVLILSVFSASVFSQKPEFNGGGTIELGHKKIIPRKDGSITLILDGGKSIKMSQQFSLGNIKWTYAKNFKNKSFEVNQKEKRTTFNAELMLDGKPAAYSITTKLLDNGLALVRSEFTLPEPDIPVRYANMYITGEFDYFAGEKLNVGGKLIDIKVDDPTKKINTVVPYKKNSEFEFFPEQPDSAFAVNCVKYNISAVTIFKNSLKLVIFPGVKENVRTLEFTIDIRKHSEGALKNNAKPYAGIDFWKNNRQYVPDYKLCKNLVQNPSFEAGLRYFTPNAFGNLPLKPEYEYLYDIDDKTAAKGSKSLRIKIFKEVQRPTTFGTFIIPLKANAEYTISFFAKSDAPGTLLSLNGFTCNHPTYIPYKKRKFKLTDEWKRYSTTFKAPNSGGGIYFSATNAKSDGNAWLDAIQLEEGYKLTAYVEKPVISKLSTSNKDNFIKCGTPVNAKLEIVSVPEEEGKVKISVEDYFSKKLFEKEYGFKTDKNGKTEIKLPLDNLPKGIFNVRVDFELNDGFRDSDFHRIAVMDFLENKHKNREIFSNSIGYGPPRIDDIIQRLKQVGIGSICKCAKERYLVDEAAKNGIRHSAGSITSRIRKGIFLALGGKGKETKLLTNDITKLKPEDINEEYLRKFEDACYEIVKANPWIKNWYLIGEPNAGKFPNLSYKDLAKLFAAGYRGMKKASPDSKYVIPAPWNMNPGSGIAWQDNFIKSCEGLGIEWGIADIHVYRTMPENPDLDADAATYFKMLEKNGLGNLKVNWGEGIYYPPYFIPEWNLSCYKGGASADHYYLTSPSYHMSWGEKISAAFYARSWLIALKYADKVQFLEGWARNHRFFMDAYLTPFAVQKIPNTLGKLLGNADFKKDIRFAPNVRCYVFEDENKCPVAALWSHFGKVDRGLEKAPTASIPFKDMKLEIYDLMEAPMNIKPDKNGKWKIPASPFPVFIRGEKDSLERFCAALNKAVLNKQNLSPLKVYSGLSSIDKADVKIINLLTKEFSGKIVIDSSPEVTESLSIPSMSGETIQAPLAEKITNRKITKINLPVSIKDASSGKQIALDASFRAFAVKKTNKKLEIDGNLADWDGIPAIQIKNKKIGKVPNKVKDKYPDGVPVHGDKDHSAEFKMAWDEDFLYLAAKVRDDKFVAEKRSSIGQMWDNDSLQVFFDTLCDARGKLSTGFDTNDYNYDFFPGKDESLIAFRRINPERQLCGGLKSHTVEKSIKTAFKLTEEGYIYEIAFPARYIIPMQLKAGYSCGFALYLNDHDGEYVKWAHTLTPEGSGAHMNPHLYPVMLLTE